MPRIVREVVVRVLSDELDALVRGELGVETVQMMEADEQARRPADPGERDTQKIVGRCSTNAS